MYRGQVLLLFRRTTSVLILTFKIKKRMKEQGLGSGGCTSRQRVQVSTQATEQEGILLRTIICIACMAV